MPSFDFNEREDKPCFTCKHVVHENANIHYVAHDMDGDWQFLCGTSNHKPSDAMLLSLKQIVELDPSMNKLHDMPIGVGVVRVSPDEPWKAFRLE